MPSPVGATRLSAFSTKSAVEVGVASGQIPQFGLAVPPGLGWTLPHRGQVGRTLAAARKSLTGGFEFGRQLVALS